MVRFKNSKIVNLYMPVMLEQALSTITTMLGTMLVGGLGDFAIASIGMVDQLNFLFMNVLTCIATGVTAIISQCIGRRDYKSANECARHSVTVSIYASLFISAVLIIFKSAILAMLFGKAEQAVLNSANIYLTFTSISLPLLTLFNVFSGIRRATGDNLSPLIGAFLSNIFYILITIFCRKILNFGISSVGFGLLASRIISSLVLYIVLIKQPMYIKIKKLPLKISYKILKPMLNIAIPNSVDGIIFNGGKLLVQVFLSGMGTIAMSANTIGNSIANFAQIPSKTFQITCVPITGNAYGTGNMEKTKKVILMQTLLGSLCQLIVNIIIFLFFSNIYTLYTKDPATLLLAKNLSNSFLILSPIFWATSFTTPAALRATGDAKFTMRISVISLLIFRIFFSWLLGVKLNFGVYGVWIGMYIDWVFRSAFYFTRIFSKKWHLKSNLKD